MGRWDGFSVESMIQNRAGGLEYIEVTMMNVIGKDTAGVKDRATALKAKIDSAGMKIWSVHMPYSKHIDISLVDSAKRARSVNYVRDMMRVAGIFQAERIVLHPSADTVVPDDRADRIECCRASIAELAPVAAEIGAVLCIENLPRTCLGRNGQEMMTIIEGFENVGICFDVNHLLYQSHADFLSSIKKGSIKTVHISDYNFTDERHLVPGVGDIDWAPVWKGIRNNGYKGVMMFECFGNAEELTEARKLLKGEIIPEKSFIDRDSLAFCNAHWHYAKLDRGAYAIYAQAPMFFSSQSICAVRYPASEFKTEILHRPGKTAGKPSEIGKEVGATMAVNACFFHVKELIPSVYFRVGENVYGVTDPAETYRVNGVVGFKDKEGKEMCIEYSNISQYEEVTKDWHTALASGPMLVVDGEIVVPKLMGDDADGDNVEAMNAEMKTGSKIRTHYSSAQFYDRRHPRAAVGKDDEGNIYYVVIDGRFKGQGDGASIYETAYICKMLGMTDAINLDGGGSSAIWSNVTGTFNHPYDNKKWDNEGERVVPNLIVAY
jgi:sugar phosphate isomerase/epimerase/exopolysaccharide biosynthesis protein